MLSMSINWKCSICYTKLKKLTTTNPPISISPCGHAFCLECANKLLKCPFDNKYITNIIPNIILLEATPTINYRELPDLHSMQIDQLYRKIHNLKNEAKYLYKTRGIQLFGRTLCIALIVMTFLAFMVHIKCNQDIMMYNAQLKKINVKCNLTANDAETIRHQNRHMINRHMINWRIIKCSVNLMKYEVCVPRLYKLANATDHEMYIHHDSRMYLEPINPYSDLYNGCPQKSYYNNPMKHVLSVLWLIAYIIAIWGSIAAVFIIIHFTSLEDTLPILET